MFTMPGGAGVSSGGVSVQPINNSFSFGFRGVEPTGGHINIGQPADLDFDVANDNFTVSVWVKYGDDLAFQRCIMAKARMDSELGDITLFIGVQATTGEVYCLAGGGENTSGGDISDGEWHLVTVTGAAGSIKLYVDATQVGSTFSSGSEINTESDWVIGGTRYADNVNIGYPYKGWLNEVTFWDVTFTAAHVAQLYNNGVPADPRTHTQAGGLIHWYQCGSDDVIPTITDRIGSDDGTVVNGCQAYLFNDSPSYTPSALDALSTGFSRDLFFDATSYGGSGNWSADAGGWTGVLSGTPTRQESSLFSGHYEVVVGGNSWWRLADHADHAITATTAVTYVVRMYTGALNASGGFYLGYDAQSSVADLQIYNFGYLRDGAARIRQSDGNDYLTAESGAITNQNKYVTIHVVVDMPNTTLKVYVNGGLLISDSTPTGSFTTATTAPLGILGNAYLTSGGFNSTASGQAIMQVVRYKQVLTDDEIARQAAVLNSLKGYL